jgi:hypothetical protein
MNDPGLRYRTPRNVRYWRKADIGPTKAEWLLLTQSGHLQATPQGAESKGRSPQSVFQSVKVGPVRELVRHSHNFGNVFRTLSFFCTVAYRGGKCGES